MTLFHGIHEVRMMRSDRRIAVGYFDSYAAAIRVVEAEPDPFIAAWATLNPIISVPAGQILNPSTLRLAAHTAADEDILRRTALLIDCDPVRPAKTNSTEGEKTASYSQALAVQDFLAKRGWPQPMLADSGNGTQLIFHVALTNDDESRDLVRNILNHLARLFDTVESKIDRGNFNAGRVCKLFPSWTRKGPHSEQRPHRRSAILEAPQELQLVPLDLLTNFASEHARIEERKSGLVVSNNDVKLERLVAFIEHYGLDMLSKPRRVRGGWSIAITCPWVEEHTSGESNQESTVSHIPGIGYGYSCLHGHCVDRHWREFRDELESRFPDKPRFHFVEPTTANVTVGGSLPIIAHATLAETFLRDNHDFVCVYDLERRPIAQWVKTRWDISGDDTLLWRAVADYLKDLYDEYEAPEKGPDPRKRFYDATFISGVVRCVKPYLPPVRSEAFDQNPHMLGLPGCRVVDLRNSAIRDMRREDYISQRINVTPDPNCPTPRFDRFISEITCGDGALANYLLRLCALCLTALPFQALFFLWGRGRNGKGVLIRTLTAILGDGKFAWPLRPSEITVSKFGDEAMKRTFSNLKGKRLVTVTESVAGNLNTSMLKLMSGGDALSGARMRQDQEVFKPTHKVLLPTNDRPQLPADPAFRGRVHMIPFAANFTGREDRTLDNTLQHVELPGILYRLITLCPDVIENGLRPPATVLAETDQLFSELDVTKQFRDDCLDAGTDAETPAVDMEKAVGEWLREQSAAGLVIAPSGHESQAEVILRELKHQPDIKYVRVRRNGEQAQGTGQGRAWFYVGVRLKSVQVSTVST